MSLEQVLALRPGRRFASLLLVVAVPGVGGPWWKVGELAVELDRLGRLREQVRRRDECLIGSPGGEGTCGCLDL